jgi:hypothetical protein
MAPGNSVLMVLPCQELMWFIDTPVRALSGGSNNRNLLCNSWGGLIDVRDDDLVFLAVSGADPAM